MIYAPAKDPKTGQGADRRVDAGHRAAVGHALRPAADTATRIERDEIHRHEGSELGSRHFNPATDIEQAQKADPDGMLKSDNANIKPFFDRGGKLLMYQGFADPQVTVRQRDPLSPDGARQGRQGRRRQVDRALHGARHVSLPGRARHRHLRQDGRDRAWVKQGRRPTASSRHT